MQIFGIILKAFLEHLSGKFEPKPETFVKFDMFDTIFNPFWTQNVEHSTKSGVRAERREAGRPSYTVAGGLALSCRLWPPHFGHFVKHSQSWVLGLLLVYQ